MTTAPEQPRRGRPATITRERIVDAGIAMGLPDLTFVGLAARIGVSHMALYKHVPNLEALKLLVADAIFLRWDMPAPQGETLENYLVAFSASLRDLVGRHPGLALYMIRRKAQMPAMIERIRAHHAAIANAFGITPEKAGRLLSTVAFHCIALADTVYSRTEDAERPIDGKYPADIEAEFAYGMHALILGLLSARPSA
ncbi:hypothetical protein EDF57_104425 [Novosphingobium sp. PhB55]|uniref:TetR/AcrR family transcriptional regulator n=1 Tax=Novosphingobium sp. PhB55 TaxID=2485106 RepID=UPI00106615BA|nr:TetR/AcrR family transcriptional regulator [Novosphingobium sp. PhB55]TDW64626.1 hypothetical protein EDF57_104425 [Novosphingobium sp. PhB55]